MYRGKWSVRKLGVLIDGLPPESATLTALRNAAPEATGNSSAAPHDAAEDRWSSMEMLLATLIDELRFMRWTYGSVHGSKSAPPSPVRRPGAGGSGRKRMSDEQRRLLDPRLRVVKDEPEADESA